MAAELPLRGKLCAEATTVFIDQSILEVMKKEVSNRQLAMVGLCVGWKCIKLDGSLLLEGLLVAAGHGGVVRRV